MYTGNIFTEKVEHHFKWLLPYYIAIRYYKDISLSVTEIALCEDSLTQY